MTEIKKSSGSLQNHSEIVFFFAIFKHFSSLFLFSRMLYKSFMTLAAKMRQIIFGKAKVLIFLKR